MATAGLPRLTYSYLVPWLAPVRCISKCWALVIRECCSGLVRHHLGIGIMQLGSSAQTGMLNFLLSVLTSWACSSLRRSNGAAGTPSKKRRQPPDDEANPGAKGNSMTVTVYEARAILRNAIRTPGRLRTGALEAIITHGGPAYLRADENVEFLRLLVEAGLDGEDGGVVAAASKALEISPANVASFISKLLKASDSKRKDSSTRLKVMHGISPRNGTMIMSVMMF